MDHTECFTNASTALPILSCSVFFNAISTILYPTSMRLNHNNILTDVGLESSTTNTIKSVTFSPALHKTDIRAKYGDTTSIIYFLAERETCTDLTQRFL